MASRISPRVVDGAILLALGVVLGTGLLTLFAGIRGRSWVFGLHGVAGLVLIPLLAIKFRRVLPRLARPAGWNRQVAVSALAAALVAAAILTGVAWVSIGSFRVGPWPGLAFHAIIGVLLVPLILVHLRRRLRIPRTADLAGRRTALQAGALLATGALAWRLQQAVGAVFDGDGERRFTGSRIAGAGAGNDFPVTSWVADDPKPIDPDQWRLRVEGLVATEHSLSTTDLPASDDTRATLDCTSGWYATRDWSGVRLGRLLDRAGPAGTARWVTVESVTGYRVCLPLAEAREALLATHVGDEPLEHGHGAPARLVAPGRRGFQWVKWVTKVEARARPDYGAWVSIFTSGFIRESNTDG